MPKDLDGMALLAKYEAELSALETRRAELSVTVGVLRRTLGLPVDEASTGGAMNLLQLVQTSPQGAGTDAVAGKKPFLGMNVLEAARLYLQRAQEPKSPADIADALRRGGVHSKSDDFAGVVRTTLSRRGKELEIENFGNATWGLSEWRPGRAKATPDEEER